MEETKSRKGGRCQVRGDECLGDSDSSRLQHGVGSGRCGVWDIINNNIPFQLQEPWCLARLARQDDTATPLLANHFC